MKVSPGGSLSASEWARRARAGASGQGQVQAGMKARMGTTGTKDAGRYEGRHPLFGRAQVGVSGHNISCEGCK